MFNWIIFNIKKKTIVLLLMAIKKVSNWRQIEKFLKKLKLIKKWNKNRKMKKINSKL